MMRKLMTATAIAVIAANTAWAAGTDSTKATTDAAATSSMATNSMATSYLQSPSEGELASNMLGQIVYTNESREESVGDINDLVVGQDGTVEAVVIGVGGFLGVGEKNVAVNYSSLHWVDDPDGNTFAVFEASREELSQAPEFKPEETETGDTALAPAMEPAQKPMDQEPMDKTDTAEQSTVTPGDATAGQGEQTAMAPADETAKPALVDVGAQSVSADDLIGSTVYAANDENVGEIGDVRLTGDGQVDAVIVDVGGFLGIGEKPVAIAYDSLTFKQDEGGTYYVYTDFMREQLDSAPTYDEATYDDERQTMRLSLR